ncbi:MAG: metallopeptidase family protein [Candidatus Eremiobacteraeota bacterium]|nr:metallopeptidase family protein [Candidatus Eremiobacteraeota bacterium]
MEQRRFEHYIAQALRQLPEEFSRALDNVEITWDDKPSPSLVRKMGGGFIFGLYEGVPLTRRDQGYSLALPDKITIYKNPIEQVYRSEKEIIEEIRRTVIHELGHHFGLSEQEIREAMGG